MRFLDRLLLSGFLKFHNLILAGDLNLTLSPSEVWGVGRQEDALVDYFNNIFDDA